MPLQIIITITNISMSNYMYNNSYVKINNIFFCVLLLPIILLSLFFSSKIKNKLVFIFWFWTLPQWVFHLVMELKDECFLRSSKHFGWAFVNWGCGWPHQYRGREYIIRHFRLRAKYAHGQVLKVRSFCVKPKK